MSWVAKLNQQHLHLYYTFTFLSEVSLVDDTSVAGLWSWHKCKQDCVTASSVNNTQTIEYNRESNNFQIFKILFLVSKKPLKNSISLQHLWSNKIH
jgi:hypothetical protein